MARDLSEVLIHLARTVGLPIEIVKYIRDEVRASGIRARQALKGHLQAGSVLRYWLEADSPFDWRRIDGLQLERSAQWKALRLNWTPREERYWDTWMQSAPLKMVDTVTIEYGGDCLLDCWLFTTPDETHWSMLIDGIRAQTLERPGRDLDATSTRPRPRHDPTRPRPRPEIQCRFTHF